MDLKTLARYSCLSERTLRDLIKQPDFPRVRVGRLLRVHRPAFDAWMQSKDAALRDQVLIRNTRRLRQYSIEDRTIPPHHAHDVVAQFNGRRIA
jgi:excisionase family DNA binding protein